MGLFLFWVVFILVVLLSVPIAAFLDKRKYGPAEPQFDAVDEDDPSMDANSIIDDGAAEPAEVEFADAGDGGGIDFAEFEESK